MANNGKTIREMIVEYISLLKADEYINITAAMQSEVTKNRLLQTIEDRLVSYHSAKIEDVVNEIELEMYD